MGLSSGNEEAAALGISSLKDKENRHLAESTFLSEQGSAPS